MMGLTACHKTCVMESGGGINHIPIDIIKTSEPQSLVNDAASMVFLMGFIERTVARDDFLLNI